MMICGCLPETLETDIRVSRYSGLGFSAAPSLPVGWILFHMRASEYPGGEQSPNNPYMYRFTRINIYEQQNVDGYTWYQIGENQWVHQFNVAKVVPIQTTASRRHQPLGRDRPLRTDPNRLRGQHSGLRHAHFLRYGHVADERRSLSHLPAISRDCDERQ